ncbi:hypothetical protein PF005_g18048 [Phytophthora fragariae]|uniref:Rho-GAP domain-containing protein n=2 Tax=Phytophthora fragariae TaxID=53985 RepID=A0A6A3EAB6_9STRA|nr:hypothetical protein PF009_g19270 [Phytophthora fragariae]KAE9092939.1 hypothetical protein PF007_g18302 [Phytophthora fragariae]KAE9193488.1 hypothetical protein PF005_g18048 [Phytophthora fragariae]KAE9295430.1 hypothetical protein PF001_g17332 [Phytophthora fragariae]
MKSRSWIKTMATSALLSPRTAFRKTNSSPAPLTTVASTSSSIPLSMLATLTRLVEFLDENHLEEEGLYSKSGVGLERKEILRFCKGPGNLPDLSLYSPHSIASAVKEILSEMYAPLVPADISRQLLEAASSGRIDEEAENAVIEVFKQIRATTREFLHVLLNHLSNLAASRPSRMSMTNLALHIGIALIRPTEDKSTLSSKNMMRRRKCVAEFLIRKASALPYDCVTEMNIPAIPELLSPPSIDVPPKQLHFIQATWDAGESSLTFEQLEEMFNKFGEIENLGINDQGNRAIIAYVTAESAEKAEHAAIPNVRIRRRQPRQGALQSKLLDMEKILSTSTAALSATKLSNEFERAVFQLHRQILDMVEECLVLAGARCGENVTTKTSANAEFLDFLEAQSKTQVTILEVEVRAGQELLRLHKTQYEKERVELEEEITALRVGRTETERLCAELRADLRKCRSELACHVANATDIQRQKSALEEKLATSDNQLHSKDVALAKLQAEYDKMYRIAAEAQMRTEKYKRSGFDESLSYQIEHNSQLPTIPNYEKRARTRVGEDLPQTSKLFSKLSTSKIKLEDSEQPTELLRVLNTTKTSSRPSNVAALEAMKQQIARNIQDQIASTKAALREMEVCSTSGKTLEEEEEELRQLQQQLATRSSEMAAAMSESRSKLQELLDPTTASPTNDKHTGNDDIASNQEPTIFDSTALVNELIARAGKASVYNSNQPFQHGDASIDEPSQHPFFGIECGQQLIEYHRPTRDAQSLLYKKWTSDRSRKIAQLATYRDQQAVVQAQQSMHTFQQTLAEFRNQR